MKEKEWREYHCYRGFLCDMMETSREYAKDTGGVRLEKRKIFLDNGFVAGVLSVLFGGGMALVHGAKYGVYSLAVFVVLAAMGVLLIVRSLRKESGAVQKVPLKELAVIVLLFVTPLAGEFLGFYLSGFVSVCAISYLFSPPSSVKSALKTALYCLVAAVAVFLIFTELLRIATPGGILF